MHGNALDSFIQRVVFVVSIPVFSHSILKRSPNVPYPTVSMSYQNSFVVFDSMFSLVFVANTPSLISNPSILDILHPYSGVEDRV